MTPVSHGRVLGIALPIVVSNATVPLLGLVDTAVVGQLGQAAPIGAVGIGSIILVTIYWFFGFIRLSISGLTSQARGRNDPAETAAYLVRGLVFGLAIGVVLILLRYPFTEAALLISPATTEVEDLARGYIGTRILAAPAAVANFGIVGWLIALEKTRSVLLVQVFMNGLNIILDILFVMYLDRGVTGVAEASFIAEWSGLLLGLWVCREAFAGAHWRQRKQLFNLDILRRMASMNLDLMLRNLLIEVAFVSFMFIGAAYGDLTLAANQILLQFLHMIASALDGFAMAAEALVGFSIGARARNQLRRSVVFSFLWGGVMVFALTLFFLVCGSLLIDQMTTSAVVRQETLRFFPWIVIAPALGLVAWMLDGVFVGATRTRDMRNAMLQACIAYFAALFLLEPTFANHGLWASIMVLNVARGLGLAARYMKLESETVV